MLLMLFSGFAGLGYQIVWTQQLSAWLGHEIISVLAVVAAFFGGLAIGAHFLGQRIIRSARPLHWYAGCELLIAVWGLALVLLMPFASPIMLDLIGSQPSQTWHWFVAFTGPFVLLLPATAAMGATLPAIERSCGELRERGFAIGALYAANTAGALLGVLGCTFVLVPWLGLNASAMICALLNLLCAVIAWQWLARSFARIDLPPLPLAGGARRIATLLFISGLLGIGYEVVVVRVLSQIAEDTVYTYALLLAVYLLGTAAGAAIYQRYLAKRLKRQQLADALLGALAAACLLGTMALWPSAWLKPELQAWLGQGVMGGLGSETLIALAAFGLPTLAMGAVFSHLCVIAREEGMPFGSALAVNTFGAALAPLLFGVLLLPLLGPKLLLVDIVIAYLLLLPWRRWLMLPVAGSAAVALVLAAFGGKLAFVDLPEEGKLLSHRDGVMAAVSVIEDGNGVRTLRINNRQQEGSNISFRVDARQAYLPLLLHPAPRDVLLLGLGTGLTARAAAEDAGLRVDAVELLPEVVSAWSYFDDAPGLVESAPSPHIMVGDARRYVRASTRQYDVIIADLFHPARSGAGALYTVEHFSAVQQRLAADGLFCQWLPLHQLDVNTLRSIVRSFLAVYPQAVAMLATNSLDTPVIGLIGRKTLNKAAEGGAAFDRRQLRGRIAGYGLPERLGEQRLNNELALLGNIIAGPAALAKFSAAAPLNTDERPVVVHRAPFITYAPDSRPRDRLLSVLEELKPSPRDVVGLAADDTEQRWQQRLDAYWQARNHFIAAGIGIRPTSDPQAMLAQVRAPLLAIVRESADFAPAYDPLLSVAMALAAQHPDEARALLADLAAANPQRREAGIGLQRLDALAFEASRR